MTNMQKTIIGTGIFNLDTIVVREYPEWSAMRPFVKKDIYLLMQKAPGTRSHRPLSMPWPMERQLPMPHMKR